MNTLRDKSAHAHRFARDNVVELSRELLEWQDTALLRDGKLRELARLCGYSGDQALSVAKYLVEHAALEAISVRSQGH